MDDLYYQLETLLGSVAAYGENPTKAESKRIRLALGKLKNDVPIIRAELVALDKKGY